MEPHSIQRSPQPVHKGSGALTVVVIDDDKRVVELLQIALSGSGYRTFAATDGEQAISLIEKIRPDIVVLDVRLPKRNGYQVCEAIKSGSLTRDIPVIMISGLVEPSARVQGLRCGAEDFLNKPFSPKELLLRIQRILARTTEARSRAVVGAHAEKELLEKQRKENLARRALADRVERLSVVAEMGRTVAGASSLDELADQLIVSVQVCLRVGTALIAIKNAGESEFKALKARGLSSRVTRNISLPVDGRLCRRLMAERDSHTLEELDGEPGMRAEIVPLRAAGLAMGAAVDGFAGASALVFVGAGRGRGAVQAQRRRDFESLSRFFGTGLTSIQRAQTEKSEIVDAVEMLVRSVETREGWRVGHSCRVARFVESVWESLGLPVGGLQAARLAALMHEVDGGGGGAEGSHVCACDGGDDWSVAGGVWNSVGAGGDAAGADASDLPPALVKSLRHCRERYDGSGGPLGLRAEEIPLEARVLAVADTFDECLSRAGSEVPVDEAIRSLRGLSGTSLDPNLVEAFVHHILNGRMKVG